MFGTKVTDEKGDLTDPCAGDSGDIIFQKFYLYVEEPILDIGQ